MQYLTVSLAFAAAALASPLAPRNPPPQYHLFLTEPIPNSDDQAQLPAVAIKTGNHYVLSAEHQGVGSPIGATLDSGALLLDVPDVGGLPSASISDFGDGAGATTVVYVSFDAPLDNKWTITDAGYVYHEVFYPANTFFLCNEVIDGTTHSVLKFGNQQSDLSLPEGCTGRTSLIAKRSSSN